MRKTLVVIGLAVLGTAALAQPLRAWVEAHWADLASGDPARVAARFAPEAKVAFLGGPVDGFYHGREAIEELWATVFSALGIQGLRPLEEPRAIAEAGLVYARVELATAAGPLILRHFHRFDEEGRLWASDYVVEEGLEPLGPVTDGVWSAGEYAEVVQEPTTGIRFGFRNGSIVLYGALESPGTGYVSVLFNTTQGKPGANILMFAVLPDGTTVYEDHHGVTRIVHNRDAREDILWARGVRKGNRVLVEFVYPLDTSDPEDVVLVPGESYWVSLSYHATATSFTVRHTAYGWVLITLVR